MPRKRLPIFQKVPNLLKILAFIMKFRKPVVAKLLLVKKLSRKKSRDLKLLGHYNYGFLGEYQFSPSSTPLIHYSQKRLKSRSFGDLHSLLFLCSCLGVRAEAGGFGDGFADDQFPAEPFDSGDEDESVDLRAERFIERFYQEMRMQRQESF
ncbi:hypothetical protein L6164_026847 [Bauhinia variegata]|uniref:Uncharacterized protein n=1 Tax=Bauhinia variegata TaxID=167791 RepID=A0ACB9LRS2_BAUVA|nr:hypothetical protein L6164_026847 [Bauhinia variegata]